LPVLDSSLEAFHFPGIELGLSPRAIDQCQDGDTRRGLTLGFLDPLELAVDLLPGRFFMSP
jgi:hypothetical protein